MRIWLVTIGEPVPVGQGALDRQLRTTYLARLLAGHGHQVTWWTSTFDHFRKEHWFDQDTVFQAGENLEIRLLHGCGYKSNHSLARFRDHAQIGRKYARKIRGQSDQPDVIVASLPLVDLCLKSLRYGRDRDIPVVLDLRDMWPDIFVDAVPRLTRPLVRGMLLPMFRQARSACANATAIMGITEAFVDWGLHRGRRERTEWDRAFPLAYASAPPAPERIRAAEAYWQEQGVVPGSGTTNVAFIGTIGRQYDLETVVGAARALNSEGRQFRFIICGTGDRLDNLKAMAGDLPNVIFPGWIDAAAIHTLMRRCSVGLDPIPDRYDYLATINNKAIEYLSAGLPVISTPDRGVLAELLARERCGLSYRHGDSEALADTLRRLCDNAGIQASMSANAFSLYESSFAAETVYAQMEEHLVRIAALRRAGSLHTKAA